MEEAPENGKESSHSAHANGMNKWMNHPQYTGINCGEHRVVLCWVWPYIFITWWTAQIQIEVHNISIILKCENYSNSVFIIPKLITYISPFKSSGIVQNRLPWWLPLLLGNKWLNLVQRWWYMRQHPHYQFLYKTTTKQKNTAPRTFKNRRLWQHSNWRTQSHYSRTCTSNYSHTPSGVMSGQVTYFPTYSACLFIYLLFSVRSFKCQVSAEAGALFKLYPCRGIIFYVLDGKETRWTAHSCPVQLSKVNSISSN